MHNRHKETQLKNSVDRTRAQRNLSLRTPLFYGQFTWSLRDRNPSKAYFSKIGTSMIRTLIHVPAVSVFKRFDCSYMRMKPLRNLSP